MDTAGEAIQKLCVDNKGNVVTIYVQGAALTGAVREVRVHEQVVELDGDKGSIIVRSDRIDAVLVKI